MSIESCWSSYLLFTLSTLSAVPVISGCGSCPSAQPVTLGDNTVQTVAVGSGPASAAKATWAFYANAAPDTVTILGTLITTPDNFLFRAQFSSTGQLTQIIDNKVLVPESFGVQLLLDGALHPMTMPSLFYAADSYGAEDAGAVGLVNCLHVYSQPFDILSTSVAFAGTKSPVLLNGLLNRIDGSLTFTSQVNPSAAGFVPPTVKSETITVPAFAVVEGTILAGARMPTETLQTFEKQARRLEPSAADRSSARRAVIDYTESFLDNLDRSKAFDDRKISADQWAAFDIGEVPIPIEAALRHIDELVDTPGLNAASGGHLGYIPGGGIHYSALGDYLAAVTNRYAGVYFASPGAVQMENALLRWMSNLVGYPTSAAGNLTSGGSIANLAAIVAARDASGIKARDWHRTVIYTTQHAHHCLDKAYRIAGLGESIRRNIPMDARFRMDVAALADIIKKDRAAGLLPTMVVAAAGTTDVGAIDPLDLVAEIAQREKLWFHIDAAYGGFFMLTAEGREKLKGIEKSDSVVMDPHKGLFLPYGLGAVLVRDGKLLKNSHHYQAAYMQDAAAGAECDSPADLSPELTKHFRGLRLWLPLKLHGIAPFRACLEEKLQLARYAHDELEKMSGFEVLNDPELSVVAFRYIPKHGDANAANKYLQAAVQSDGRVFISSTTINDLVVLRIAILCFRTHLQTVQTVLDVLKDAARKLELPSANHGIGTQL